MSPPPAARPTGTFAAPVQPLAVTSDYGPRRINGEIQTHFGTDFRARTPVPVAAMDGGTILFFGSRLRDDGTPDGFGNRVIIDHGNGVVSAYAHLSAMSVRTGAEVRQGQRIGTSGNTGASQAPHLHVETNTGGDVDSYRRGQIRYDGARHFDAEPYVGTGRPYSREANLRLGDEMPAVRTLQQHLVDRGYDLRTPGQTGNGVDGSFGGATQTALAAFQRDRGMPAAQQTGVYERVTQAPAARTGRLRRSLARAWSAALGAALAVTAGACTQPASAPSAAASDTSGRVPDEPAANAPRARPAPGAGLSVGDPLSADLVACLPAGVESDAWAMTGRAEDGTDVYVHAERVSLGGTTDYDPVLLRLRDSTCDGHFVYETDSGSDSDARPSDEAWKVLEGQSFSWHVARAGGVEALADIHRVASEGRLVACPPDDDMGMCLKPWLVEGFVRAGVAVEPYR